MIAVFLTLTSLIVIGVVFGVGYLVGASSVLSKQRKQALAQKKEENDRLSWVTDNKKDPLKPPSKPWGPNY